MKRVGINAKNPILIIQNIMDNEENLDKLSEARSSRDETQPGSLIRKLYAYMCPCLIPNTSLDSSLDSQKSRNTHYQKEQFEKVTELRTSMNQNSMMSYSSQGVAMLKGQKNQEHLFRSVYEHANRLLQDYDQSLDKSTIKKWHSYPIYEYKQGQVQVIGTSKGRILCKINSIRVQPSASAKKKSSKSKARDVSSQFVNSNFDKYWNRRYYLFEKFDEGISLDQESWYSVTPEAVAEHIAERVKCDTVLDGLCGAGGNAIKFSSTCSRVLANDQCPSKLRCLQTNAKVHCVQNIEVMNEDFLTIQGIEPDVVYLSPSFGPDENLGISMQPQALSPALDKAFRKAIQLSRNIVLLLPPNMNVRKLGELIAKEYIESGAISSTCSIKIEKIFFLSQLKYLVVYFGPLIEKDMSLNDELVFIYNYLKEGEKKTFIHKKVIRELRQKYGMIGLLNFVLSLDKVDKPGTLIEKLYQLIRQTDLIPAERMQKLTLEQVQQYERYSRKKIPLIEEASIIEITQQEKYTGEDEQKEDTEKERTMSYYSGMKDTMSQCSARIQRESVNSSPNKDSQMSEAQRKNTIQFCMNEQLYSQQQRSRFSSGIS